MIGVFDSGVGGITVLRALRRLIPDMPMLYLADFGYCPYGGRSEKEILNRSHAIIQWMKTHGASLVVVACHTSSSVLMPDELDAMGIPVLTMLDPTAQDVLQRSQRESWKKGVGLIATELTIQKGALVRKIQASGFSLPIHAIACPHLAPLIESCQWAAALEYLSGGVFPFFQLNPVDGIIYGCTHYPFIEPWIRREHGCPPRLDPAHAVAMDVEKIVKQSPELFAGAISPSPLSLYYTGTPGHGADRLKRHCADVPSRPICLG